MPSVALDGWVACNAPGPSIPAWDGAGSRVDQSSGCEGAQHFQHRPPEEQPAYFSFFAWQVGGSILAGT